MTNANKKSICIASTAEQSCKTMLISAVLAAVLLN